MKTTLEVPENKKAKKPFPKYMYSPESNRVVLFQESGVGTLIKTGMSDDVFGEHFTRWYMESFKDLPEGSKIITEV